MCNIKRSHLCCIHIQADGQHRLEDTGKINSPIELQDDRSKHARKYVAIAIVLFTKSGAKYIS